MATLGGVHFVVARNHLGAAAAQPRDFAYAFSGGLLMFEQKFSGAAHRGAPGTFRLLRGRGEMEQVGEFFFVAAVGIGTRGPHHAQASFFEDADDVVRRSFSLCAKLGDQLAANLFDFGGRWSKLRLAEASRDFEDQRLLLGGRASPP